MSDPQDALQAAYQQSAALTETLRQMLLAREAGTPVEREPVGAEDVRSYAAALARASEHPRFTLALDTYDGIGALLRDADSLRMALNAANQRAPQNMALHAEWHSVLAGYVAARDAG